MNFYRRDMREFKIAVVDNDTFQQKIYESLFVEVDGIEWSFFQEPNEILEYLKSDFADIMIIDIELYGMDGFELAERILKDKLNRDGVIIFTTKSFTNELFIEKAYKMGAIDYIIIAGDNYDRLIAEIKGCLGLFKKGYSEGVKSCQ